VGGRRLRVVDASLERLAGELHRRRTGPDGRPYHDLAGGSPPASCPRVRLLPEFDALFCGFEPKRAPALVDEQHHAGCGRTATG
jgi:hypothetical protein